jgi:hypothetical protein
MPWRGISLVRRPFAPTSQARVLTKLAVIAGLSGILSTLPVSAPAQIVLLTILVLTGAGSALLCWLSLSGSVAVAGVFGVSVATVTALPCSLLWLNLWHPVVSCLILSVSVLASGLVRLWTLRTETGRGG